MSTTALWKLADISALFRPRTSSKPVRPLISAFNRQSRSTSSPSIRCRRQAKRSDSTVRRRRYYLLLYIPYSLTYIFCLLFVESATEVELGKTHTFSLSGNSRSFFGARLPLSTNAVLVPLLIVCKKASWHTNSLIHCYIKVRVATASPITDQNFAPKVLASMLDFPELPCSDQVSATLTSNGPLSTDIVVTLVFIIRNLLSILNLIAVFSSFTQSVSGASSSRRRSSMASSTTLWDLLLPLKMFKSLYMPIVRILSTIFQDQANPLYLANPYRSLPTRVNRQKFECFPHFGCWFNLPLPREIGVHLTIQQIHKSLCLKRNSYDRDNSLTWLSSLMTPHSMRMRNWSSTTPSSQGTFELSHPWSGSK